MARRIGTAQGIPGSPLPLRDFLALTAYSSRARIISAILLLPGNAEIKAGMAGGNKVKPLAGQAENAGIGAVAKLTIHLPLRPVQTAAGGKMK